MKSFVCILLMTMISLVLSANQNPGHLKVFGSVGSQIHIEEINRDFPTVSTFFTHHIVQSEPIVSRQVLIEDRHYSIWQTNEELLQEVYGLAETNIDIQSFKSRRPQQVQMSFKDFLSRFEREPLLFADQIPGVLQKHLTVPKPLQCDASLSTFESAILLMNGINASPLLFHEEYDQLHCLLRGSKRFVLVNTLKYPDVRKIVIPERQEQRGPPFNPDRVDFDQFPALVEVDYHLANLTSGDCLLIPNGWIFQERSLETSIAILYNIRHHLAVTITPEELNTCTEFDPTFTLDQIDWSTEHTPTNFKELIMSFVNLRMKGFDQWQDGFSKYLTYDINLDSEASGLFEEFFALVDIDGNGEITENEVEQITGEHLRHIGHILYEMTRIINTNRKKTTPKPVDIANHQESIDTHLHIQPGKADL